MNTLAKAGKGRQGFEQVAIPQKPFLYNYALHLTMDSEDAKDLVQDTYLKAYRFWDKFETGTNIKGWLYQIMKNSYINLYRKKTKEPRKVEYDETKYNYTPFRKDTLDLASIVEKSYDQAFGDEVAGSLDSLPDIFKKVVLLCDVEDFTYAEIAKMTDCPVGTVRSRLHRGRKHLQKELSSYAMSHGYALKGV
jgi:RNA polymerase sigma-70 factor (ECF subfamily)